MPYMDGVLLEVGVLGHITWVQFQQIFPAHTRYLFTRHTRHTSLFIYVFYK